MLFSVPIFSESTYVQDPDPYTIGLDFLTRFPVNSDDFNDAKNIVWEEMRALRTPIISLYYRSKDAEGVE